MLWNVVHSEGSSEVTESAKGFSTRDDVTRAPRVRQARLIRGALTASVCLVSPAVFAQSYVPAIVPTASTTLFTATSVISPGRVAVDKAGNVFYVATGSSSSLMEIPAATQTGTNATPVTLVTGLGQYNAKAVVVDANGNLWVTTGNQQSVKAPGSSSTDYVSLVEIPALNSIPNTGLVGSGATLSTADAAHCTATGTALCTVFNYKLNDAGGVVAGPQAIDFSIDTAGNITYVDIGDNNLPSGMARVVKSNVYNGGGSVLATVTQDYSGQVAVDGAGNTYYCSPSAAKVSQVSGGTLTTVGVTSKLGAAAITSPNGISSDVYGNLYIAGTAQLSEVPFEGTALNFVDEFGIVSGMTNTISTGGGLDQNGNYYYAYNGSTATKVQQLQINGYNFGSAAVGTLVSPTSTPAAASLTLYVNVAPSSSISSYFPTGSPTTNTTAQYLQSFPYSGTKSFAGGSSFSAGAAYTITMDFQPIHPGLLKGSFTPRSGGVDDATINLQGNGVGPEPLFFPGTPSLLFNAAASSKNLNAPQGIALDSYGDVFVADTGNGKVVADCLATTTQNEDGTGGNTSNTFCSGSSYTGQITQLGTGFVSPVAIALDGAESLYVLDSAATGTPVTLINGQTLTSTSLVPSTAMFGGTALSGPMGLAIDGSTNLYIADTGNNRIVEAHQFGATVTDNIVYVPSTTSFGGTKLSKPSGLAVDAFQNLFIADTGNNRVVEYSAAGVASLVNTGSITLSAPYSVAVYPSGQLIVTDKGNGVVLVNGASSAVLSLGTAYTTTGAQGVALDLSGNIYVSNTGGSQVLELNVTSPQTVNFPNTADGSTSPIVTQNVTDEGNASLVFTGLAASSNNFVIDSSSTCTATSTVTVGSSCAIAMKFTPQSVGPLNASVTLTDNQLGYTLNTTTSNETATFGTSGTQALNLTGIATSQGAPQTITFTAPASPIVYTKTTAPITLSATASSGLAVTFTVVSGPGTISGKVVTVTGVGTIVVAANQPGSASFSAAPQVMQSIVVSVATPTFSFVGGTYNASYVQTLMLADATPGAAIYFTTNGTTPTTSSTLYSSTLAMSGITLSGNETVEAIAVFAGSSSAVASESFVISTSAEALTYALNPTSLSLAPGQSGTITISVTPQNGIVTTLSFGCTGLPIGATCSFNPATVATAATQAAVSTVLTVTAPTTKAALEQQGNSLIPEAALAVLVGFFGWRKRRNVRVGLLLALLVFSLGFASGCGSSSSAKTSPVTVAISGDAVRDTATFNLTLQ